MTLVSDTTITGMLGPEPVGRVTAQSVHPNTLSISMAYEIISISKTVFLSGTQTDGNMGGIAGANAFCQADAFAALLPGSYWAWLSESVASGGSSPSTTFETLNGPYRLAGGTQVAAGFADLTDGGHGAFNQTANGTNSVISFVWAGTLADGTANATAAETCNEWTSVTGTGRGHRPRRRIVSGPRTCSPEPPASLCSGSTVWSSRGEQ
jgi:hypothetical protein